MDADKRPVEVFWWEELAVGKTGPCSTLVGRVMLSKSLIQFLLMSRTVFSLCSLTLGQTMLRVMVTSFKRTYASKRQFPRLLYSVPLTLWQATVDPLLHQSLLDTDR